jgi:hypothetical protein
MSIESPVQGEILVATRHPQDKQMNDGTNLLDVSRALLRIVAQVMPFRNPDHGPLPVHSPPISSAMLQILNDRRLVPTVIMFL